MVGIELVCTTSMGLSWRSPCGPIFVMRKLAPSVEKDQLKRSFWLCSHRPVRRRTSHDDAVDVLSVRATHVQRVRDFKRTAVPRKVRAGAIIAHERIRQRHITAGATHRADNRDAVHARYVGEFSVHFVLVFTSLLVHTSSHSPHPCRPHRQSQR